MRGPVERSHTVIGGLQKQTNKQISLGVALGLIVFV